MLEKHGIGQALSNWTRLPPLRKQLAKAGGRFFNTGRQCVIRLLPPLGMRYDDTYAACLSFINILWQALRMGQQPEPAWWPRTYVEVARDLEQSIYKARGGAYTNFRGHIWQFVEETVEAAHSRGLSVLEAGEIWYSGAFLLETVPSVLFILMRYAHDPEEAIVRAVNDTKDNDTSAAIVGAAMGALHGRGKIPKRWLANLTGRTEEHDDGRVYELLDAAHRLW